MQQETYLERIKKIKSSRKITNDRLSEMTGIPLGTLSKLLAGVSESPKLSNIVAISRALDCSLDWLITGVPANTHNYTLEPEEMTLVESWRAMDAYGRELTRAVVDMERARALRQSEEEAIKLHEVVRRGARRGAPRLRRPEGGTGGDALVFRRAVAESARGEEISRAGAASLEGGIAGGGTLRVLRGGQSVEGKESSEVSIPPSLLPSSELPVGLRRRNIGLYDMPVSAGVGEFLADATRIEDISIPDDPRTAEADYALRINGDSMEPKYHSGDILLIQTADLLEEGELGVFVLDGAGYFKKYAGDRLVSLNPQYPPIPLKDFQDVTCCGRVVGKLKRK